MGRKRLGLGGLTPLLRVAPAVTQGNVHGLHVSLPTYAVVGIISAGFEGGGRWFLFRASDGW